MDKNGSNPGYISTQVPSIDVETPDTRHFGFSRLKTQGQAKLRKCPDEFLT